MQLELLGPKPNNPKETLLPRSNFLHNKAELSWLYKGLLHNNKSAQDELNTRATQAFVREERWDSWLHPEKAFLCARWRFLSLTHARLLVKPAPRIATAYGPLSMTELPLNYVRVMRFGRLTLRHVLPGSLPQCIKVAGALCGGHHSPTTRSKSTLFSSPYLSILVYINSVFEHENEANIKGCTRTTMPVTLVIVFFGCKSTNRHWLCMYVQPL